MNVNNIILGFEGKTDMLKACFGSSDDKPKKKKPTANDIKSFVATNNALRKKKT